MYHNRNYSTDCELKFFDIDPATYAVDNAGSLLLLFIPILGTDSENCRTGRKTVVKSIFIRGKLELFPMVNPIAPTGWVPGSLNRIILFVDWQPNGVEPTLLDVLKNVAPESQLNQNNRRRFTIIKDKQFVIDPTNSIAIRNTANFGQCIHAIKWFERVNIETIFNADDSAEIDDIQSGAIYLLMIGSNAHSMINPVVQLNISVRCRFADC